MENVLAILRKKVAAISTSDAVSRARKGAYVDCILMLEEVNKAPKVIPLEEINRLPKTILEEVKSFKPKKKNENATPKTETEG